jgi:hypothetical protein
VTELVTPIATCRLAQLDRSLPEEQSILTLHIQMYIILLYRLNRVNILIRCFIIHTVHHLYFPSCL